MIESLPAVHVCITLRGVCVWCAGADCLQMGPEDVQLCTCLYEISLSLCVCAG